MKREILGFTIAFVSSFIVPSKNQENFEEKGVMWERSGHFEGDIILPNKTQIGNAADYYTWPRAEVPYTISHSFGRSHRRIIERAFREFTSKTCIRFRTRTSETDYIYINSGEGCSSAVGRHEALRR